MQVEGDNGQTQNEERSFTMLEYENEMFLEILQEDGLIITAKGLGMETVFTNILNIYLDPGNLVIVLGTTDFDEKFFIEKLTKLGMKNLPRVISAHDTSNDRQVMYLEGGVMFISGRIFVVDLLKNRVPVNLITGILVYRAHTILSSYQEAFAICLYRRNNKSGFIKAFSNSALAFTAGFATVERVMKALFLKKLYLWPRFHTLVNYSLSKHKPQVIELHVKITPKMLSIQTALLDVMNYIIKDLKRINKYLDLDELTLENAISRKFYKQLQLRLDPMWHQLSSTSTQRLTDLKTLRTFLMCLTYEDAISFYVQLNRLRTMEYAMRTSGWLMLDPVENLFKSARERVYTENNELKPEPNPKWTALTEVLREIHRESASRNQRKVLVLAHDSNTCNQLKNYLTMGANKYLLHEAVQKLQLESIKEASRVEIETPIKSSIDEDLQDNRDCYVLKMSQTSETSNEPAPHERIADDDVYFEECRPDIVDSDVSDSTTTTTTTTDASLFKIQSLKKGGDPMALQRALIEYEPDHVVLYITDISAVRQLEIYANSYPSIDLKVYFLIYGGSVEEQEYLTSLRREKEAFHTLISTKKTMIIPEDQDGKSEDGLTGLAMGPGNTEEPESTRKAGGQAQDRTPTANRVIVDMREFRSELPALLHKRGMEVEPVTLLVGDYILSPEICIERKSVSDLIGSLNSGRLYNQAVAMTRHYSQPMLLIEFDQNKPFCLQGNYYVSKDIKNADVTAKLQLLTLHFPQLKLVWSPNPHATAQLFEELKQGKDQPEPAKAAQIGADEDAEDKMATTEKYNSRIQDFIAKLPGVHTKNLRGILNRGGSLDRLIKLTKQELRGIMGHDADARNLYSAFHDKCLSTKETSTNSGEKYTSKGHKKLFSRIKKQ